MDLNRNKDRLLAVCVLVCLAFGLTGCNDKFFDPSQIGRFRPVPAVNVILDSLGVAEEPPSEWAGAEDPKPIDTMIFETDYSFAPGDVLRVSVFELLREGDTFLDNFIVSETGRISIPEVGIIEVAGLSESQLEQEIAEILSPAVLKDPIVTVISLQSEQRAYSILGNGVPQAGRYPIPRYDYRLNDALAQAGVATQFNTSYVYVARNITERDIAYQNGGATEQQKEYEPMSVPEKEMLEVIAPRASVYRPQNNLSISFAEMATDEELTDAALPEGFKSPRQPLSETDAAGQSPPAIESPVDTASARVEWIFKDGKWVPVAVGEAAHRSIPRIEFEKPAPGQAPARETVPAEWDWDQIGTGGVQTRLIKIPTDRLAGGDPRYNIVIRPGDVVHVPLDLIGEVYIMGNINNQGVVNLTGRPMTLKMVIAAAGGLGPLAWPKKCEITRRIGKNREETVMVDLDKIAAGEEPDFFVKPNDLINVGTHETSRFRAVLLNAFRATYGFGFIYDRNFSDRDFATRRPIPNWF